ncbi:MAG: DUF3488 domain-containing transglutaminase family protein, partial [Xanthomonadales bacterium]|nr:DUF3488 domain-containing transglutaminase family protein [Xanthomonadales bacterium]
MSDWRQHPLPWLIATVALDSLPQLATMSLPLVLFTLAPLLWRGLAAWRNWKPLPALARVSLTFASLVLLVLSYGNLLGRRAAIGLLTVMLAMKLLECFRARDARVVASLTLFLCSTQFLFAQGLFMVVYGIGVTVGALVSLPLIERHDAWGRSGQAPPAGSGIKRELGFGSRLLLLAIPLSLAVFLLFPRWGTPLWGLPEQSLDARTGLSTSMTPGSIQGLFMDDSPAFRASFEGDLPSRDELYWRGPVLWNFDGRSWTFSGWMRGLERQALPDPDTAPYRYEVQLEPNERHWLFAIDYPGLVPDNTRLTEDFQLLRERRHAITSLFRYDMVSDPGFPDSPELSIVLRNAALQLPEQFNPRTRELITRWREETRSDAALVRRVLAHFNEQPFRYTLNPPLLSRHSVDEFLFETRSGFCEHYASAFTVMMRMAGIPARVVTGYQGGWYNELGEYLLIRQSDAHAWAEVWLPAVGWTRIDPTAAVAP